LKASLLPDKLTPLTSIEAMRALREGYRRTMGKDPSSATLAVHMAQSALETGRWKKIHWNDFGNEKAGPNYEGFYTQFRCNEVIDGQVKWFSPPHPQCNFRAYPTAIAGAAAHMLFLSTNGRYRLAWYAAEKGDPDEFVVALKQAGYFTAALEPYRKAVTSLFREFLSLIVDSGPQTQPAPPVLDETEHSPMSDDDMAERLPLVYLEPDWDAIRVARDAEVQGKS
jgi:hypothetical protein